MKKLILIIAILLVTQGEVWGQEDDFVESGNNFLSYCELPSNRIECLAFLNGYVSARAMYEPKDAVLYPLCPPQGVTMGQTLDVILKYIKDNPKLRHHSALIQIPLALEEAFPCPKSKK